MNNLALSAAAVAALLPAASVSSAAHEEGLFIAQFDHILGTSLELKIVASSYAAAHQAQRQILTQIDRLTDCLSSYRIDSEFSQWQATFGKPLSVSLPLWTVLQQFDTWQQQTGGIINAGTELVAQLWQKAAQTQVLPTEHATARAVAAVNEPHWYLDPVERTATRLSQTPLRLHTFTKGYVLDQTASAALDVPGIKAVVLNSGGDLVVRGDWQEPVRVADPRSGAENGPSVSRLTVANRAVATSGSYRRGVQVGDTWYAHLIDPRTGLPARDVLSATVVHQDAVTAGALATTFAILNPADSAAVAAKFPDADYLLLTANGETHANPGWAALTSANPGADVIQPQERSTQAYLMSVSAKDKRWKANQELQISLELPRFEGRSHRPFVAVWVEDEAGKLVRQLALWYNKPRWLHELREWYNLRADETTSTASATRSPGEYTLVWDGKDDRGEWVKQGKYTIMIEAAREHGSYQLIRQMMDFNGKPKQQTLIGNVEISSAALDYREKSATR